MTVVPMVNKREATIIAAMDTAFKRLGGDPKMLYTDAEGALTSNGVQDWLKDKKIIHNITLTHAGLAEKMIGYVKNRVIKHIREEDTLRIDGLKTKWYDVMDAVVKNYNEDHVSSTTKMTPNEAAEPKHKLEVKTNLESIRRSSNPQPLLTVGDQVRVVVKKKNFEKPYKPNYTEELYTVAERVKPNFTEKESRKQRIGEKTKATVRGPIKEVFNPQVQYRLLDPNNKLQHYKKSYMRSELLKVN